MPTRPGCTTPHIRFLFVAPRVWIGLPPDPTSIAGLRPHRTQRKLSRAKTSRRVFKGMLRLRFGMAASVGSSGTTASSVSAWIGAPILCSMKAKQAFTQPLKWRWDTPLLDATSGALAILVRVAGRRWTIEERFQTGKSLVGLDQHQVRRWRSWYRWTILAMLAHAFPAVAAGTERARHPPPSGLTPLTCNEVQHLLVTLVARPAGELGHRLGWSDWRRRHQARARTRHYRRQANRP